MSDRCIECGEPADLDDAGRITYQAHATWGEGGQPWTHDYLIHADCLAAKWTQRGVGGDPGT